MHILQEFVPLKPKKQNRQLTIYYIERHETHKQREDMHVLRVSCSYHVLAKRSSRQSLESDDSVQKGDRGLSTKTND